MSMGAHLVSVAFDCYFVCSSSIFCFLLGFGCCCGGGVVVVLLFVVGVHVLVVLVFSASFASTKLHFDYHFINQAT